MNATIVSLCDDNRREISDATAPTFEKFSQKSGIKFIRHTSLIDPSRHVFWNKFPAVLRELPTNDWVMWVDADIMSAVSPFNPKAFTYHMWANHGNKNQILKCIEDMQLKTS